MTGQNKLLLVTCHLSLVTILMSVGYLELLRENRGFRQLWLGQVVSQLGDWFDTIAVMTLVLNLTG